MDSERAETYLRLLAEADLRRATTTGARSSSRRCRSARLALAAQALSAVGAVDADVADQIQAEAGLAAAGRLGFAAPHAGPARLRLTSERTSLRVVPAGQVIEFRDGDLRREMLVMAYLQAADGARLIAAGWPVRPFTAVDDRGVSYYISWPQGPAVTLLPLRPDPPHQIRWLDLAATVGEPATRIDLGRQVPAADVTVTPAVHSPGELLLDVIAARLLFAVVPFSRDSPGQLTPAGADLRAFVGDGPGQIVETLHAAGILPPGSPIPGQLAGLCARIGLDGHGISAPPAADLPERWQSLLTSLARREPRAPPAPSALAAPGMLAAAELPELDGAQITIMGLDHGERGTILHLLVSGVTLEDDWSYARGVMPLPVLWIRDSDGRWHATHTAGRSPWENAGIVVLSIWIVPALDPRTAWIEIAAAGRSAQLRAILPLSPQLPDPVFGTQDHETARQGTGHSRISASMIRRRAGRIVAELPRPDLSGPGCHEPQTLGFTDDYRGRFVLHGRLQVLESRIDHGARIDRNNGRAPLPGVTPVIVRAGVKPGRCPGGHHTVTAASMTGRRADPAAAQLARPALSQPETKEDS